MNIHQVDFKEVVSVYFSPPGKTEKNAGNFNKDSRLTCQKFGPGCTVKISYNHFTGV
jgi:hypothetical protein